MSPAPQPESALSPALRQIGKTLLLYGLIALALWLLYYFVHRHYYPPPPPPTPQPIQLPYFPTFSK